MENQTQSLKVGDIVKLKSGSPYMTVTTIIPGGKVNVTFYDEEIRDFKVGGLRLFFWR